MNDEPKEETGNEPAYLRHRRHRPAGQGRRTDPGGRVVAFALDGKEYALVADAAKRAKLKPSSWAAAVAVALAEGASPPMPSAGRDLLGELNQARTQLGRYGNNVNQAVRQLNATGDAPAWLVDAVRMCVNTTNRIDLIVQKLGRRVR